MTTASADPLVACAHQAHLLAGLNPRAYERRIVRLALVGAVILHSVWVVSLLAAISLIALAALVDGWSLLYLAAGLVALATAWLWLLLHTQSQSSGVRLHGENAPALISLISDVARTLGAPNPTRVELVPDFNAWVQVRRRPRGQWQLSLGLPLLLAADVNQLKAIVGHELGHFTAGTFAARLVWSQQAGWYSTLQLLGGSSLGVLIRRALRTWGERFQVQAVAMARQHERSSDAAGARVAGPPPEDVFVELRHFLEAQDREDIDRYYRSAMSMPTLAFDVHPSVAERIASLGETPALPGPVVISAAVALLGDQLEALSRQLGSWWARRVRDDWNHARDVAVKLAAVLAGSRREPTELHPADALELARALRRAGRVSEAIAYYRRAAQLGGDDFRTRLGLGLAMLETGDPLGLLELRHGISLSQGDPEAIAEAFWGARRFLEARGEPHKNPFAQAYQRVQLARGRMNTLLEWRRLAAL